MPTSYAGRTIPTTTFTGRTPVSTTYTGRVLPRSIFRLKIDSNYYLKIDSTDKLIIGTVQGTPYTARTPI